MYIIIFTIVQLETKKKFSGEHAAVNDGRFPVYRVFYPTRLLLFSNYDDFVFDFYGLFHVF